MPPQPTAEPKDPTTETAERIARHSLHLPDIEAWRDITISVADLWLKPCTMYQLRDLAWLARKRLLQQMQDDGQHREPWKFVPNNSLN
jgi:hypothetical protein